MGCLRCAAHWGLSAGKIEKTIENQEEVEAVFPGTVASVSHFRVRREQQDFMVSDSSLSDGRGVLKVYQNAPG